MINHQNKKINDLMLKYNFIISNLYFLFNNTNINIYLNMIEKIKIILEEKKNDDVEILKKSFKIINLFDVLKEDFSFLEKECVSLKDILYEILYDFDLIYSEMIDNVNEETKTKVKNNIDEINSIMSLIDDVINVIYNIKNFNFDLIFTENGIRKLIVLLYDFKRKIKVINEL